MQAEAACTLWTAVEAFSKMTGEGLSRKILATDLSEVLAAAVETDGGGRFGEDETARQAEGDRAGSAPPSPIPVETSSKGCRFVTWARGGFRFCICSSEPIELDISHMQSVDDALIGPEKR